MRLNPAARLPKQKRILIIIINSACPVSEEGDTEDTGKLRE